MTLDQRLTNGTSRHPVDRPSPEGAGYRLRDDGPGQPRPYPTRFTGDADAAVVAE
ncbi:hypothetical protein [Nocardiopsis sp. FIRDI 009]|uniref:hypothetical protein n=1 Tax=Nocardiopsis sp. FIRDI 009 TaxID=714197 RepID=UPI0013006345|nr:hypothetical protein [Nocardiopsis sp. FIRDI 009]